MVTHAGRDGTPSRPRCSVAGAKRRRRRSGWSARGHRPCAQPRHWQRARRGRSRESNAPRRGRQDKLSGQGAASALCAGSRGHGAARCRNAVRTARAGERTARARAGGLPSRQLRTEAGLQCTRENTGRTPTARGSTGTRLSPRWPASDNTVAACGATEHACKSRRSATSRGKAAAGKQSEEERRNSKQKCPLHKGRTGKVSRHNGRHTGGKCTAGWSGSARGPRRRACKSARGRLAQERRTRAHARGPEGPAAGGRLARREREEKRGRDSQRRKVWDERKGREWQGAERAVRSEERTGGRRVLQPGLWERMRRRSGGHGAGNKELRQRRDVGSTLRAAGEAHGIAETVAMSKRRTAHVAQRGARLARQRGEHRGGEEEERQGLWPRIAQRTGHAATNSLLGGDVRQGPNERGEPLKNTEAPRRHGLRGPCGVTGVGMQRGGGRFA
ncbi:hypothetical protein ERJ75_000652700 [Trypanosoma vivax]|nr:hypothetical protein ERJ75_000652700 [Trypanosoma vivax]